MPSRKPVGAICTTLHAFEPSRDRNRDATPWASLKAPAVATVRASPVRTHGRSQILRSCLKAVHGSDRTRRSLSEAVPVYVSSGDQAAVAAGVASVCSRWDQLQRVCSAVVSMHVTRKRQDVAAGGWLTRRRSSPPVREEPVVPPAVIRSSTRRRVCRVLRTKESTLLNDST
jgi:hypothetical protein